MLFMEGPRLVKKSQIPGSHYSRTSNPEQQLLDKDLEKFPGLISKTIEGGSAQAEFDTVQKKPRLLNDLDDLNAKISGAPTLNHMREYETIADRHSLAEYVVAALAQMKWEGTLRTGLEQ